MLEEQIVGKWKYYIIIYDFHRDGTYEYFNTDSGLRTNGRYSISDNIITFFIASTVTSKIFLDDDKLTMIPITPQPGNAVTFTRVY